ncbi:methyltransferase [Paracoccus thiocyanatus]|uniref:Methyltransferase n=1 Tax=Paracoccus thiocyanatus TaxID=34006 RepID=A0A3D8PG41_9RHOB|nr:methyltransferase [Paracoccus thiocyanatus]RDW14417.1 methyltransferase [Paracoccus thiocyanatus]
MIGQNRSSAVMQQRAEPHDSLDDFPTPPWATRALCEWIQCEAINDWDGDTLAQMACREPAANRGYMARVLGEYFGAVDAADTHDYGVGYPVRDYLFGPLPQAAHWTITNPPFRLAERFIQRALASSRRGVAVIVRSAFLEGVGRYRDLFSALPPSDILQFTERVVMHKGRLSAKGSTATAYCWIVWRKDVLGEGTRFHWIEPCRKRLEREGDYPPEDRANTVEGALL